MAQLSTRHNSALHRGNNTSFFGAPFNYSPTLLSGLPTYRPCHIASHPKKKLIYFFSSSACLVRPTLGSVVEISQDPCLPGFWFSCIVSLRLDFNKVSPRPSAAYFTASRTPDLIDFLGPHPFLWRFDLHSRSRFLSHLHCFLLVIATLTSLCGSASLFPCVGH